MNYKWIKTTSVLLRVLYLWGEFGHVPELCILSGIGFVTCCGKIGSRQTPIKLLYFKENVFIECHRSVAWWRITNDVNSYSLITICCKSDLKLIILSEEVFETDGIGERN